MRNPLGGRRPSAPLVLSTIALFVSLGGAGYAASGGNFVLGQPNTATTPTSLSALVPGSRALRVVNNDPAPDSTALTLGVADGHAPFTVDSDTKVINLNADKLDNLSSAAFLRKGQPVSAAVNTASGVLDVTDTGSTNGVSGKTESAVASGVYGEHVGSGGFGVAGRAGDARQRDLRRQHRDRLRRFLRGQGPRRRQSRGRGHAGLHRLPRWWRRGRLRRQRL